MRYGVASRDITPREPVMMAGYAARTEPSHGIYQPLLARVLVVDDGERTLVWVTADLIGFSPDVAERVAPAVAAACGVPEEAVLLSASHTHCGPTLRASDEHLFGAQAATGFADELVRVLPELAVEAQGALREGTLHYSVGRCTMGVNRRRIVDGECVMAPNPEGTTDPDVAVLTVREAGRPKVAVVSYGCHPTTMGGQDLGPDYPGFLRQTIEAARPEVTVLFANGCAGDVKPHNVDADGRFRSGPLAEVERCGREVGEAALAVLDAGVPVTGMLAIRRETVELPLQPPAERGYYEAAAAGDNPWLRRWAQGILECLDRGEALPTSQPFVVQAVTIGEEFCLLTLGGEVVSEIGLRLKAELSARYRQVMVVGYTQATTGYQAARRQFPEGGYEVEHWARYGRLPAPYRPDIEDHIAAAASRVARLVV